MSGSPVFVYLGGVRRHFPFGGELTLTQYAGAIHLLDSCMDIGTSASRRSWMRPTTR